ncbi:hypothetical protein C2845_PM07G12990 [Panicum miliaceum]|uniref:Uncharacterized protein n=1 Tax=Panicum miliaceum TaxID=4540 RepID=A0A3L6SLI3_PANMI|nr:hypothetical protein C2845_PM07G12990 [Panicum miliaceum]
MCKKSGRVVLKLRHGSITSLNTEEATTCLKYISKSIELNGPNFDWLHSPVDFRAIYQCSCGGAHGKWATFNGTINEKEALPELKRSHTSVMAATRQRQEEEHLRKEAHDSELAKDYAQSMLEWGRTVQSQFERIMPIYGGEI